MAASTGVDLNLTWSKRLRVKHYDNIQVFQLLDTLDMSKLVKYEEFLPSLMRLCWDEHRAKHCRKSIESDLALVPFSSSFFGAVLFADISGFTRLSSSLSPEQLKRYINSYFATVLGVIESYNGDVVKFCGDALLVVWPVSMAAAAEVKEAAVMLAAKCALNLVNKSLAPPSKGTHKPFSHRHTQTNDFRFHCGVSCGLIHGYVVGTASRLEFLVSGYPVELAGNASAEAANGQVCCSVDARDMLKSLFETQEQPNGNFLLLEMIPCNPSCFRCRHLSTLYRLTIESNVGSDRDPLSAAQSVDSPANRHTPRETPRDTSTSSTRGSEELDEESPAYLKSKYFHSKSVLGRLSESFYQKMSSNEQRVVPTAVLLTQTDEEYSLVEEKMKAHHVSIQRNEAEVADFLMPYSVTSAVSDKQELLQLRDDSAEAFYGLFVGKMVQVALESDMVEFIAEMKLVTTVFIDIIGANGDFNSGLCESPQNAFKGILRALEQCGGFLRQYLVDDKGCVAICGFGVPGYCHSDDSVRALEAAVRITQNLRYYNLQSRIGIAVGHVYCGLVGSNYRCEYTMMGASVNLAARLMGKCEKGRILVSEDVMLACVDHFQFEGRPDVKAKGFKAPISVFTPVSRYTVNPFKSKNSVQRRTEHFVGRSSRLDDLNAILETYRVASGKCPFEGHIIEGPIGMGKRSMIAEIYHTATEAEMAVVSAVSVPPNSIGGIGEYDTIAQILTQIFSSISSNPLRCDGQNTPHLSWDTASLGHVSEESTYQASVKSHSDIEYVKSELTSWGDLIEIRRWLSTLCSVDDVLKINVTKDLKHSRKSPSCQPYLVRDERCDSKERTISDTPIRLSFDLCDSCELPMTNESECVFEIRVLDSLCLIQQLLPALTPAKDLFKELPSLLRDRLREALILFIIRRCLEVHPMIFIIHAFHWCDMSSLKILHALCESKPSGLFLLCGLDMEATSFFESSSGVFTNQRLRTHSVELSPFGGDPLISIREMCKIHKLEPFGYSEVIDLMQKLLTPSFLAANPSFINRATVHRILERTNGVPALLVALITILKETGVDGEMLEQNVLSLDGYTTIDFDSLHPTEKFVLKVCSVIGIRFSESDAKLLVSKLQSSQHDIDIQACFVALVKKKFLISAPVISGSEDSYYQFSSSFVHDNVYNVMLHHQKSKAHGIYARLLEQRPHTNIEHLHMVIHHYSKSNDNSKKYELLSKGLQLLRGTNDGARLMEYLNLIITIWTKGPLCKIFTSCCTHTTDDKMPVVDERPPRKVFAVSKMRGRVQLPPYLGSGLQWVTPSLLISPYNDMREEKMMLPCWMAQRASILFSQGALHSAHNEAMLALHVCGILKEHMFVRSNTEGELFSIDVLRSFNLNTLVTMGALFLQLAAINAMFSRRITFRYFMRLSNLVDQQIDAQGRNHTETFSDSFYFFCLGSMKGMLRRVGATNDLERIIMLQRATEAAESDMSSSFAESSQSTSALSTAFLSDASAVFASFAGPGMTASGPVSTRIVSVQALAYSTHGSIDEFLLPQILVSMSEGKFSIANALLTRLRIILSNHPFMDTLGKYGFLLSAWCAFLSGKFKRAHALVDYLQEFSLACKQSTLYKWSSQLRMLSILFSGHEDKDALVAALEACVVDIKNRTQEDGISACASAVLALALVSVENIDKSRRRALALARYAADKLAARSSFTIIGGIYLFLAGYAAALLMKHDNIALSCLSKNRAKSHRGQSPRIFQNSQLVVEKALSGLSNMSGPNNQPCLKLLHEALALKLYCVSRTPGASKLNFSSLPTDLPLTSSLRISTDTDLSYEFDEFKFGIAFLQTEQLHFLRNVIADKNIDTINHILLEKELVKNFELLGCSPMLYSTFSGPTPGVK